MFVFSSVVLFSSEFWMLLVFNVVLMIVFLEKKFVYGGILIIVRYVRLKVVNVIGRVVCRLL